MDITSLTLAETIKALKEKQFSGIELFETYRNRVDNLNPTLNAFLEVEKEGDGIPVAVKDVICTKGIKTTAASKILENFTPPYDATTVKKLKSSPLNLVISGKTNCDEFAMGSSGENSAFGPSKNPWDFKKVSGGSSSGSAVAVAADMSVFSLGSDTGGSIRQPASFCGVVGFKPSYGTVSRYGLISMASSLDQIGVFTKSVADVKLVMEIISGGDNHDSNSFAKSSQMTSLRGDSQKEAMWQSLKRIKVGLPKEYFGKGLNPEVEKIVKDAAGKLEDLGAEVVEVSLPHTEYAIAAYYILMSSEASSNLARFDGIRFGLTRDNFGPEVKRRIMLGTFALSSGYFEDYFIKAAKVRTLIRQDFEKAFALCDVIVGPVSPTSAWSIGEKTDDPLMMYLSDVYTVPSSLAGLPGLSVPAGFTKAGLPVGLQILGRYNDDKMVLKVGGIYQNSTDWRKVRPKLGGKA